jgi:hypothetical protein
LTNAHFENVLAHSKKVIVVLQPPRLPDLATRSHFRQYGSQPVLEDTSARDLRLKTKEYLQNLQTDRLTIIDAASLFVSSTGEINFVDANGQQLFHDRTHLSGFGAKRVATQIEQVISNLLLDSKSEAH